MSLLQTTNIGCRIFAMIGAAVSWVAGALASLLFRRGSDSIDQELQQTFAIYDRTVRPQLSPRFVEALIQAEDRRFMWHSGIDLLAVIRAVVDTFFMDHPRGGSTIEQQLVRVVTGRRDKTFKRKIVELFLAARLGRVYTKSSVAGMYLTVGYFGAGMNGIVSACRYLDVEMSEASCWQSVCIVARLRYPEPMIRSTLRSSQIRRRATYIYNNLAVNDRSLRTEELEVG
jgi:membrane peptidoglycan carboxypeptidase